MLKHYDENRKINEEAQLKLEEIFHIGISLLVKYVYDNSNPKRNVAISIIYDGV